MKNIFHVENLLRQSAPLSFSAEPISRSNQIVSSQPQENPIDLRLKKEESVKNIITQALENDQFSSSSNSKDDQFEVDQECAPMGASVAASRSRTLFSDWQLACLEWRFARNKYLTSSDRRKVAELLHLRQVQVKTWFQNRRMKWKRQILASGATLKSPTKPKGRPKKNSIPPIDD